MHAVVSNVSIKDREKAEGFLRDQILPALSEAPGFLGGYWVNVGGDTGNSISVWESEDAAKASIDGFTPPPQEIVVVESMEIGEVVANV